MEICRTPKAMRDAAARMRAEGHSIALVPTMGYLHEGHLSLVRIARRRAERVVASLFVNPTQFGPGEDLHAYPRNFERDRALCEEEGVDALFAPGPGAMYAPDHSVYVVEDSLSKGLCGESRPGHFRGVLTVVLKLFNLVAPDVAVFGEKDAQQLRLIRRMARDLDVPVDIAGGPIVREADGVAMSSRNANLSPEARAQAPALNRALNAAREAARAGETRVDALRRRMEADLAAAPLGELDYLEFVDDETLEPAGERLRGRILIALAVRFPGARLIDNHVVEIPA